MLEGRFVSDDGTITEAGVPLRDDEWVRPGTPIGLTVAMVLIVVKRRHEAKFRRSVPAPQVTREPLGAHRRR
jgi:hypothetical protein